MCRLSFARGSYSTRAATPMRIEYELFNSVNRYRRSSDYITRLNFGFAADRIWTHTFHLTLPEVSNLTPPSQNDSDFSVFGGYCMRYAAVKRSLNELTNSTTGIIRRAFTRIKNLIPDIRGTSRSSVFDRPRRTRGFFNISGTLSNRLFGTAEESQIDQLKAEIETIKGISGLATADASRSRNALSSAVKLQNERFDRLNAALRKELKSMDIIHTEVRRLESTLSFELDVTAYMASELAVSMSIIDDISQIELGIESLLHGHLTPRLISFDQIARVLQIATLELNRVRYHLCLQTPQAIYANAEFDVTRHDNAIFVRLRLPVSVMPDVSVYRTEIFDLPVPGKQGLITSLTNIPQYLVFRRCLHWSVN